MAIFTVRNIPEELNRALRARAALNGQSLDAEVREILESAISSRDRVRLGSMLAEIVRQAGLSDDEFAAFEQARRIDIARLPVSRDLACHLPTSSAKLV